MKRVLTVYFSTFLFWISIKSYSQQLQVGIPYFEERIRLSQLTSDKGNGPSFLFRPISIDEKSIFNGMSFLGDSIPEIFDNKIEKQRNKNLDLKLLPIYANSGFVSDYPYPVTSNLLVSGGFQSYITAGAFFKFGPLNIQLQPEFIFSQNSSFEQGPSKSWNTEYLEKFGFGEYSKVFPGQSSIKLNFGAFSTGVSTQNIWWGPGQFNSLLFSNNAFGFPHLTFNTRRPAKTFLGSFEGQVLIGRLEGSNLPTTNVESLIDDWRYLNGLIISYQPKWLKGVYFGISRVFQQYESMRGDSFSDYFPIFNDFQKKGVFENGNDSGKFDQEGRDQQLTVFGRYVIPKAKSEFYFEYGRRDHAYDWRDAILSPEHARAYIIGFTKLLLLKENQAILIKGEMTQQQEAINIIIRYPGTSGSLNWSGHGVVRHGFSNFGQMLGPGIGPSSNSQTLEISWLDNSNKLGARLERLNRYQDYFTANFGLPTQAGRWVDYSFTFLGEITKRRFIILPQLTAIKSLNQLWLPISGSTADFPLGNRPFSFQGQLGLIYKFSRG